jgi:putative Ca2+/H+ antiporter (TMEM165/GDT1 family)
MSFAALAGVFGLIFLIELPDKTMVATIVMSSRARPLMVFLGASSAFVIHMGIAAIFGGLLTRLPHTLKDSVVTVLFLGGAAYLLFVPEKKEEEEGRKEGEAEVRSYRWKEFATAFTVIFVGEFGDLSQIQAANLVAKTHEPLAIFAASSLALITVCAIGSFAGKTLLRILPLEKIRIGGGLVFAGLGIYSLIGLFTG